MSKVMQVGSGPGDTRTDQERRDGFEHAEASLALSGLHPSGSIYNRVKDAVIAGQMTHDEAAAVISASFGPDVE